MKTNSDSKWEPKITNNTIDWPESDREQVAKILQENITFSGQIGNYVIHGAIEKLLEWRKLYSDKQNKVTGETSDGYHTFNELYEHRHILFLALLKTRTDAWKSWKHEDGSAFDGWFIAGIGDKITYHIPARLWDAFTVPEVANAPKWDGHTSNDVIERLKLLDADQQNKELREEIGRLNAELMDDDPAHTMNEVTTQAHFLKGYFTAKQLRDIADEIEPSATQRSADDWKRMHDRVYQLAQKQESEIQRLKERNNYLEEHSNERFEQANELNDQDQEIQRLTKEVEELREKMTAEHCPSLPECYKASQEITRLRELLGEAKDFIPFVYINGEPERHTSDCKYPYGKCRCHLEELLTDIDNALDPSGPRAMGPGH